MKSSHKRTLFWGLTLLFPFAFLLCLELAFRATSLFAPEPLVLEVTGSGGSMLKFNPWVTRRYFDSSFASLPNLTPEVFTRVKDTATIRILCLGESTTAGFPFECTVPFPAQLRELFARAYPQRRIEVLNAGMAAISSYVVLDVLPELLEKTSPDLVVAYLGHNEFYGVYGSGSTLFPGKKRFLVTLMLRLQHMHVVRLVKHLVQAFQKQPQPLSESRTLMQSVIGNQDIALGSDEYKNTMEAFRANLEAIADCCRDHGVPLLVSSLVSNYRDQPPFHSLTQPSEDRQVERVVLAALRTGDSLLAAGRPVQAERRFQEGWNADSNNADMWYGIGRSRLALGDTSAALRWLIGAKDRDAMRFRATEEANEIIATTAEEKKLGYVDMRRAFADVSPGGIIGNTLMCDHLHPTPQGYFVMASALFRGVVSMGVFPPPDPAFSVPHSPYGVTDLDWEIGLLKIFRMIHEWPFKQVHVTLADYRSYGDTTATRIAIEYLRSKFAWTRAHDMLAHVYFERGELERARNEYRAIAVYQPDDPWPHQQLARLYEAEENWPLRSAALQAALTRSPVKGMLAYHFAISEWKQGHLEIAISAMAFASGSPELKPEERHNALFYLAGFLSDGGRREQAIKTLHTILTEDPSFVAAQQFLARLERTTP